MARKQRNNVDYFPHSCIHGKKMFYLRNTYGNDGYAVWFMLLEELGKAEYHYLDLQNEVQLMFLSSSFAVDKETLIEIIEVLVKFNEFDEHLWKKEMILYNPKFIENIADAYKKRNNACIDKLTLIKLLHENGRLKDTSSYGNEVKVHGNEVKVHGNPQSIVKYSKEKYTKVNNGETVINFFRIRGELIKERVSEYILKNFNSFLETWQMQNQEPILLIVLEQMNTDYNTHDFTNENHLRSAFKTTWKKIKNEQSGSDSKQQRTNSVSEMAGLAERILNTNQANNNTGSD